MSITQDKTSTIQIIQKHLPNLQAIYLFGSYGTEDQTPESDVDIALLLPHEQAKKCPNLYGKGRNATLSRRIPGIATKQVIQKIWTDGKEG